MKMLASYRPTRNNLNRHAQRRTEFLALAARFTEIAFTGPAPGGKFAALIWLEVVDEFE